VGASQTKPEVVVVVVVVGVVVDVF